VLSTAPVSQRGKAIAMAGARRLAGAAALDPPIEAAPRSSAGSESVRGRRIHFVDLLRLLAATQMVHGHTMDALLAEELRDGAAFERWSWGRGLVSVAFLFAAGLAYHLSTLARFAQHRADGRKVLRRFRRAAWLVLLGYSLHFPVAAFFGDASGAMRELAMVDVLQCIGLSIAALELMTLFAKSARQVVGACAVLGALALVLAPLGERLDPSGTWRPLVNYLTHQGGSLFPLLPWAAFVFAGVVVGQLALPQGVRTPSDLPLPRLMTCAAAVLGLALLAHALPFSLLVEETSRNSEPAFNLLKLGVVLAIVTLLAAVGRAIPRLPRVLQVLAGESLIIYVVHLVMVYGAGVGLRSLVGPTLPLPAAMLAGFAMIALMVFVGLGWFRVKSWREARRG
jgi:uncharacterized membrane protein